MYILILGFCGVVFFIFNIEKLYFFYIITPLTIFTCFTLRSLLKASAVSLEQPKLFESCDQKALVLNNGNNANMIPSPGEPFKKYQQLFTKSDLHVATEKARLKYDLAVKAAETRHLNSQAMLNYAKALGIAVETVCIIIITVTLCFLAFLLFYYFKH